MKCSLCGYVFNEVDAEVSCKNCLIKKGCKLLRCPKCRFEMPSEPKWLKSLMKRRKDNEDK